MTVTSPREGRYDHPWLIKAISVLDASLRRRQAITEYTRNPLCIFRLQIVRVSRELALRGGTRLRPGERMVDLHFWNEHVPPALEIGTTVARACQLTHRVETSLRELAHYLARRPDLGDVAVIRINFPAVSARKGTQVARILAHFGFEAVADDHTLPLREHLHRFGENILISLVIMAHHAGAVGRDSLLRTRMPVYLARRILENRFSGAIRLVPPGSSE